jgi:hypothetical protein
VQTVCAVLFVLVLVLVVLVWLWRVSLRSPSFLPSSKQPLCVRPFIKAASVCDLSGVFDSVPVLFGNSERQTFVELSKEIWLIRFETGWPHNTHNTHTHTHTHTSREKQQLTSTSAMMTLAKQNGDYRSERESRTLIPAACASFS